MTVQVPVPLVIVKSVPEFEQGHPSGARNVNYEGIRCEDYAWKLYAGLNADHDGWDRTVENEWTRIENGDLNAYHAALYQDYFCSSKLPVGKADVILNNIKYKRANSTLIRGSGG